MNFQRNDYINLIESDTLWDIIVIGGGATGLGTALDAALRGYKVLLVEQADFAKGTSSRSTKLVHGGVRYLAQGDIGLVYEALHERGLLFKNAPHLVKEQEFIIPCYSLKDKLMYLVGLKFYDLLAGKRGLKSCKYLSAEKVIKAIPGLKSEKLKGGVQYSDGQFDDARLAINIAQTCAEHGGALVNYMKVAGLLKTDGKVSGIKAVDLETNKEYAIRSRAVVNATGVFVDEILHMDSPTGKPLVRSSQGVHLVLDKSFIKGDTALMIPKTDDGRVLFAVPWHGNLLIGTTDTPLEQHSLEPVALDAEINFILKTAGQYLTKSPSKKDVLAVFAGLRPLAAPDKDTNSTKEISRSHKLIVSESNLVTMTGGKWTTYRKMAEVVVDKVIALAGLNPVACASKDQHIHGYSTEKVSGNELTVYGTDTAEISKLIAADPSLKEPLMAGHAFTKATAVLAVRNEMARTVEDVLARRLRILFLDARVAIQMAPGVAALIAKELNLPEKWQEEQVTNFTKLANQYLLEPFYPKPEVQKQKVAI